MSLLANYKQSRGSLVSEVTLPANGNFLPSPGGPKTRPRLRTWNMSSMYHCSIVGTCLTTAELRQVLNKIGELDTRTATDHALHSSGVRAAGRHDVAGKLLNKALDRRHEATLKRFAKLSTAEDVRRLWNQCVDEGDIAGAYWAVMTHPATDHELVKDVFGEVHMLSHLVGSSSRLDIARLRRLQLEIDAKDEKIARQEDRLHHAAQEKDILQKRIEELETALLRARATVQSAESQPDRSRHETISFDRMEAVQARADELGERLVTTELKLEEAERKASMQAAQNRKLQHELDLLEAALAAGKPAEANTDAIGSGQRTAILYVGGRRNLFDHLRALAEDRNVELLLHDGGVEDNVSLLPSLVGQASAAVFPVDCISHTAVGLVKRLCRDSGKRYVPMRSASVASFLAAIATRLPGI